MTALFQPYSHHHFQALPNILKAADNFAKYGGISKLNDGLSEVVHRNPIAATRFGIQLLHRHSNLKSGEVLLAWDGTTFPIRLADVASGQLANIVPTIWGLKPGTADFVPLEFAFVTAQTCLMPTLDRDLARDVAVLLHAHGLERMLGLAILPQGEQVGLEATFGRANVVMSAQAFNPMIKRVEVLWRMPVPDKRRRCIQQCVQECVIVEDWPHSPLHDEEHEECYC
ncbi:hypothetical protein OC834_002777 [Tilletia horrida]|nr:hypothetical protein OC834_002777 [Tilletia horrida]